jgi:hypothetical protein
MSKNGVIVNTTTTARGARARSGVVMESKRSGKRAEKRTRQRARRRVASTADKGMLVPFSHPPPYTVLSKDSQTPDRTLVRLRYLEPAYLTGSMTGGSTYVDYYRINSIFDPYAGTGGGQPAGTARMFSQYRYCRVWASTIHVNIARAEHQQDYPWDFAVVPLTSAMVASPPSSFSQFVEQPYAKLDRGVSVYADQSHTITQRVTIPKLMGVSEYDMSNPEFRHTSSTNPTFDCRWAILLIQPIVAVDNTQLSVEVYIEYECEFFDRNSTPGAFIESVMTDASIAARERAETKLSPPLPVPHHHTVAVRDVKSSDDGLAPPSTCSSSSRACSCVTPAATTTTSRVTPTTTYPSDPVRLERRS